MIRLSVIVAVYFFLFDVLSAQKNDYIWLSGYQGIAGNSTIYDSVCMCSLGTTIMDFNYTPRQLTYDTIQMRFDKTNVSYCNDSGNLLFYTNGISIANSLNLKIANSDSLNDSYFINVADTTLKGHGYRNPQGMIALENPRLPNQYYLVHTFVDFVNNLLICKNVKTTLLDMNENGGLGEVFYKNRTLCGNNVSYGLAATRHANGKYWWVLSKQLNSECFYSILIDSFGVHVADTTCPGPYIDYNTIMSNAFSLDGNQYVSISYKDGLSLYYFNRCTGELYHHLTIPMPFLVDSGYAGLGVAFSPNGRFLYVMATLIALQYDLWAPDIAASVDTVAVYDGFRSPFGSYFVTAQNGPDGKIYISCGNSENDYHVIEEPDRKGDSCIFTQHGLMLPSFSIGVPYFPNYRLGAMSSKCDPSPVSVPEVSKEDVINLYPNPATNYIIIDYGFTDWSKGDITLEVVNSIGQIMYQKQLPRYSGFHQVDVTQYLEGIYSAVIKRQGATVASEKFVKY